MTMRSPHRWFLSSLFSFFAGGKGLIRPEDNQDRTFPQKALVLSPGIIPTTDIYLKKRLRNSFKGNVRFLNSLCPSRISIVLDEKTVVVVVRYAPLRWLRWLVRIQEQVAGIIFMMDDDMPKALHAPELPLGYAIKTAWRYALTKRMLDRRCREIWLSTTMLARRYGSFATHVKEPAYVAPEKAERSRPVFFYHGTRAHRREIKWLVPIVKEVQQSQEGVWFEISGDNRVRRLYAGIPRVRVLHPMSWPDYLDYAASCQYQIGLAPCLETDFNTGRSHTKIFDITRMGAAGIYSSVVPYVEKVMQGKTGLLCKNDREAWVAAILLLLRERSLRDEIAENARMWCEQRMVI